MTLLEAIDIRRSRRKYLATPIAAQSAETLQKLIAAYNAKGSVRMELVLNNGSAFGGLRKSYGLFSGVTHYVGLIANKSDFEAMERLGYYGEMLVLHAVTLGLGTCWVGGFDRSACPFDLPDGEMVICAITVGNTAEKDSMKERLIRGITHRKTKTIEEMYHSDVPAPDWFIRGIRAVQKAPSAVNRQPVLFTLKEGKVTAAIQNATDIGSVVDLGIAKRHFELGAGKGAWEFGSGAAFVYPAE